MTRLMTKEELKELVKINDRYKGFTILDKPAKFNEIFADKDASVVQLHSIQVFGNRKDMCGLCGKFSWKNGVITSLDGDSYSEKMTVYGYCWFNETNINDDLKQGLDILVGTDW